MSIQFKPKHKTDREYSQAARDYSIFIKNGFYTDALGVLVELKEYDKQLAELGEP